MVNPPSGKKDGSGRWLGRTAVLNNKNPAGGYFWTKDDDDDDVADAVE